MKDKPILFSLPQNLSINALQVGLGCEIRDTYHYWLTELSELEQTDFSANNHPHHGNWAYFPWRNEAIHIPEQDDFRNIFFSRNYPIIDKKTQNKLWDMKVAIAGLSVGSNIAIELVKAGVSKLKIADFDTLAPSNNNRITGGSIFQIGENKSALLAKKLYELNPYCEIEQFPEGLTEDNLEDFVRGCDIIVDEIDSFPLKNRLRDFIHSEKGKHTILLQGADLGENPIVEIEGYHDPKFGGRVHELDIHKILHNNPTKLQSTRMLVSIVGRENIPSSFLQNFINIKQGKQRYWAQLGLAATAVGAKMAGIVIEIAKGNADKLRRFSRLELGEIKDPEETFVNTMFDKEFGYISWPKRTLFSSDEALLSLARESGNKNKLTLNIGDLTIAIEEIHGNNITDEELSIIHKARHSYSRWGDDLSFLLNDPTDFHWKLGVWETSHLIASVEGPNNFHKLYALKKTYLSFNQLKLLKEQNNLPLELAAWNIKHAKTGENKTLWNTFTMWINNNQKYGNIATTTRFCTISERKNESQIEKEAAAITFAAMQLFTSETTPPDLILNIITKPSLKKVFPIKYDKKAVTPAFHQAGIALGLARSWKTILDQTNPIYTFYASKVPKYFTQNPMLYITHADQWRQSSINLLKEAKEKYK
jgi:predicted ThiF/HesA family dinucleotide-utilizing enzyme